MTTSSAAADLPVGTVFRVPTPGLGPGPVFVMLEHGAVPLTLRGALAAVGEVEIISPPATSTAPAPPSVPPSPLDWDPLTRDDVARARLALVEALGGAPSLDGLTFLGLVEMICRIHADAWDATGASSLMRERAYLADVVRAEHKDVLYLRGEIKAYEARLRACDDALEALAAVRRSAT